MLQLWYFYLLKANKYVFFEAGKDSIDERKKKCIIFPTYSSEKIGSFTPSGIRTHVSRFWWVRWKDIRFLLSFIDRIFPSLEKYVFICTKHCLFVEVMRLETCLYDENIGPQGYSLSNLTITSVICYVASVVVPDSIVVNMPQWCYRETWVWFSLRVKYHFFPMSVLER